MKFPTQYSERKRVFSRPGSRIKVVYGVVYDEDGKMDLVPKGQKDIYAEIQSHADSVDINIILKRFANGDVSALNARQGSYGDFTNMPSTYAEALNVMARAEELFNSLPVDERAKYNHSLSEFIASFDKILADQVKYTEEVAKTAENGEKEPETAKE